MPVTPTGFLSVTADATRRTLAASSTFQTETGSANATAALAHIFYGKASDHVAAEVPPRAIIDFSEVRSEQTGGIETSGQVVVTIQIPVGSSYLQSGTYVIDETKWNDAWLDFMNKVGAIWREMDVLIGSATYMSAFSIEAGGFGIDRIAEDITDRKDESNNTIPAKDTFYFELILRWRGA